jgi:putative ABC transport system permease protein
MWRILLTEFFSDLKSQKLRTFLTLMAITWGTFAVVILLSFGEGLSNQMIKGMLGAGNRIMMIYGGQTSISHEGLEIGRPIRFVEDDIDLVSRTVPHIESISPQYGRFTSIGAGSERTNTYMEGVNPDFEIMRTMYPAAGGRFLNEKDVTYQRRVAFIGNNIAERLYGEENPIGQEIFVDQTPFIVVGVMEPKLQTGMNYGPDSDRVIIPYTTFRTMYGHRYLSSILLRPTDAEHQELINSEFRRVMAAKYKFDPADEQAIRMWDFIEAEKMNRQVSMGLQIFMLTIGLFTLIIAGVGVANIMYVVVKERTHEIGVKKAVGARKKHIVGQFIFESMMICIIGGLIGIFIAGSIVTGVQSLQLDDGPGQFLGNPVLSYSTMILTAGILSFIGLIAGVFPAIKAAKVDPVESLRYE